MCRETVDELSRHERREGRSCRSLLDHRRVETLELVEQPGAPAVARHPPEQLGHPLVDGLLGRAELRGHLGVAEAAAHHVEDRAVLLVGVLAPGQPLGDHRVDGAAAGVHLTDRAHQLVALRHAALQQVREPAVAATEQRDRVLLVVVRG